MAKLSPSRSVIRLYVGNLSYGTTELDLTQLFTRAGVVQSVHVVCYPETGFPRGFAFVQMTTEDGASAALATIDGVSLGGRNIAVTEVPLDLRAVASEEVRRSRAHRRPISDPV